MTRFLRPALPSQLALMGLLAGPAAAQFVMPGEADPRSGEILAERQQLLDSISPVTDAMLADPPAEDWLTWRRTLDGHGASPLDLITTDNVSDLRMVWSWALNDGPSYAPPLVHDGVMFVYNYGDRVQALDARDGELLWTYDHQLPQEAVVAGPGFAKKAMAIFGDTLLTATSDLQLVALDMKSGTPAWSTTLGDWQDEYAFNGGPIIADGVAVLGATGCGAGQAGGCFLTGVDAATGERLWTFQTLAQPGEAGDESWGDLPLDRRFGGSVWVPATYDSDLDLVYFGIGQPYPWNAEVRGSGAAPDSGDALLYTNSTLAIRPRTGELVWHHQHLPNDSLDMDYAFERQVVEIPYEGETRKAVVTAGKMAIFEALDAETGEYLFSHDVGIQNVVTEIDPDTGAKVMNADLIAGPGETSEFCPHAGGARSFPATAYDAQTHILYVPMQEHCASYSPAEIDPTIDYQGAAVSWKVLPYKRSDGTISETAGRLEAIDLSTREAVWTVRPRFPQSTASLVTAGGLVFQGALNRYFRAYDKSDGTQLWEVRLGDVPNSFPVTYAVDDRQYVAVVTGGSGPYAATWNGLLPDLKLPPELGSEVYVFALPDR